MTLIIIFMKGHTERVRVRSIVGSVSDQTALEDALEGVDVVFHSASVVDVNPFPDYKRMEETNVNGAYTYTNDVASYLWRSGLFSRLFWLRMSPIHPSVATQRATEGADRGRNVSGLHFPGTANVIAASVKQKVSRLIYTSTVEVTVDDSWDDIHNEGESQAYPERHIYRGYSRTKCLAEQQILAANGTKLHSGEQHLTVKVMQLEGKCFSLLIEEEQKAELNYNEAFRPGHY